ncbi:preprotein translocase [candidate division WWE3 bacterium RIFOXYC1_FULL_40_10]|uniref:Sec-independent protein translocase protein TatA n=1 Tax=candidate division WWE3 bacterium RIFOXYA2_FULL_46_9 TaxID=1802636 RepID=A0A1F4W0M6_UNCKA|nr:MAG: preprotein translocase [candidate division WWE3 bacterium RIFOXYB1_FULL_40_22]OGC62056.1 MAG: preprotein translocase [candidate division WWE3 bacterium RIFOXYA1_FULL_40_11]OGC62974.1 MAG: preprotein translocase [candidate division WWE3 bacterium RIFOXYA2_FULL_46_9]OGC64999.1 MAG: preprotein translocase [candidate division WWE3 bacterium RIFOXYB2_FULL_41_6]OGC66439.1 MAG: preprotein translocase [candidate division WWE3 bacterium RIFOXYC1_FULL_40_10]OGC67237.1 MAG: preprotein translocase
MFGNIGTTEIVVVLLVLLLLFGGKKLPELARGLGDAIKEFKSALKSDGKDESKKS